MKNLYAPWRSPYAGSDKNAKQSSSQECIFCNHLQASDDEKNFILKRFSHAAVMFNRYPYNAGHLLVVSFEHIGHLEHLSQATRAQLMEIATASTIILQKITHSEGFNIGINIGNAAGASIPTHLHMHILPRWTGDTNFLPTLSETKVISFDLHTIYRDLKPHFDALSL